MYNEKTVSKLLVAIGRFANDLQKQPIHIQLDFDKAAGGVAVKRLSQVFELASQLVDQKDSANVNTDSAN